MINHHCRLLKCLRVPFKSNLYLVCLKTIFFMVNLISQQTVLYIFINNSNSIQTKKNYCKYYCIIYFEQTSEKHAPTEEHSKQTTSRQQVALLCSDLPPKPLKIIYFFRIFLLLLLNFFRFSISIKTKIKKKGNKKYYKSMRPN